jgi:hypothetical protein
MSVYFVRSRDSIKIGYAADVSKRLAQLQTGSAYQLKLLTVLPDADKRVERYFHEALSSERLCGEWFRDSAQVKHLASCIQHGARPKTPVAIAALLSMCAVGTRGEKRRFVSSEQTLIPISLIGTEFETVIMAADATKREYPAPSQAFNMACKAIRLALQGKLR